MTAMRPGLYEVLVTEALAARLEELADELLAPRDELRDADAADRIALHLARVIRRSIAALEEGRRAHERAR